MSRYSYSFEHLLLLGERLTVVTKVMRSSDHMEWNASVHTNNNSHFLFILPFQRIVNTFIISLTSYRKGSKRGLHLKLTGAIPFMIQDMTPLFLIFVTRKNATSFISFAS